MNCIRRRPFRNKHAALWFEPAHFCELSSVLLLWVVVVLPARAQTAGSAIYGVTNIDVAPSATSQGIALLKRLHASDGAGPGRHT